jgi:hypothetical protein
MQQEIVSAYFHYADIPQQWQKKKKNWKPCQLRPRPIIEWGAVIVVHGDISSATVLLQPTATAMPVCREMLQTLVSKQIDEGDQK